MAWKPEYPGQTEPLWVWWTPDEPEDGLLGFHPALVAEVLKLKRRVEPISGQQFSYVKLEDVLDILALSLTAPGEAVTVKALEWAEQAGRNTTWRAESSFGRYLVYMRPNNSWAFEPPFLFGGKVGFRSPNEAMAAAQADYEQQIRSALHPTPPAAPAGEIEAAWRTMDSAPRDGRWFAVRDTTEYDVIGESPWWIGTARFELPSDGEPEMMLANGYDKGPVYPTHWAPLAALASPAPGASETGVDHIGEVNDMVESDHLRDAAKMIAAFLKNRDESVLPEETSDAERLASADEILAIIRSGEKA